MLSSEEHASAGLHPIVLSASSYASPARWVMERWIVYSLVLWEQVGNPVLGGGQSGAQPRGGLLNTVTVNVVGNAAL